MENLEDAFKAWIEDEQTDVDFDIWAQSPEDWRDLSDRIPGLIVSSAGGIGLYQAEGLLHGLPFYYREKQGWASLRVGQADGDAFSDYLYHAGAACSEWVEEEQFSAMMLQLVPKLQKSPFLWKFSGKKLIDLPNGDVAASEEENPFIASWGFTPEEAYQRLHDADDYLTAQGYDEAVQHRWWELQQVNPVPKNYDNRVWPNPEPDFKVNV